MDNLKKLTEISTWRSFLLIKTKKKSYEKIWIKIKDSVRSITKNSDDQDEKYMKIKFGSDDNLLLNKTIEIPIMTIVFITILYENNEYYPQFF